MQMSTAEKQAFVSALDRAKRTVHPDLVICTRRCVVIISNATVFNTFMSFKGRLSIIRPVFGLVEQTVLPEVLHTLGLAVESSVTVAVGERMPAFLKVSVKS